MTEQCWYCGCGLEGWGFSADDKRTDQKKRRVREHQTPKSRGGTKIVIACFSCNSQKGTKDLEEYRAYLRAKFPTMKAANALREVLPALRLDFRKEIETVAVSLEFLTPRIVFFGEKRSGAVTPVRLAGE